jgi:serralysin
MHSAVPNTIFKRIYDGSDGQDTLVGANSDFQYYKTGWADYEFNGFQGSDLIIGGHGDDVVYGDAGNDVVSGGYGYNELFGSSGIDTLDYTDFGLNSNYVPDSLGVNIQLSTSTVRYGLTQGQAFSRDANLILDDEFYSFENVNGSAFNDKIYGNGLANDLDGGGGNDIIVAGSGADYVVGGSGSDRIYGESGNDDMFGGTRGDYISGGNGDDLMKGNDGADRLYGGAGSDDLYGNSGADQFVYRSIADSTVDTSGRDLIHGFSLGYDQIDLEDIDTTPSTPSTDGAFTFIGNRAFSDIGVSEIRYRYGANGADFTVIEGDINGNGNADFAITVLGGRYAFIGSDFDL